MPDVVVGAQAVLGANDRALAEAYLSALGDLVWFDAYFDGKAPSPELTQAINALAGENSLTLARAIGFAALASNPPRLDEAEVKLSAVAQRDALSRVGLLAVRLVKGESKEALAQAASDAIAQLPPEAWSALARWTLRDLGPINFRTPDTDRVVAESAKLDDAWLGFAKDPRAFYVADVDAVDASLGIAEPMLTNVVIQNISNRPLLLGPGGPINGNVIFDANVRGRLEQPFLGAGVARLAGPVVLPPRGTARGTARIDNAQMFAFMLANPHVPMSIFVSGITNAASAQNGLIPGPGGMRAQSASVFDRGGLSWDRPDAQTRLTEQLAHTDPVQRQRAVYALSGNARALLTSPNANDASTALAGRAIELINDAITKDASPSVRATAVQELMGLADAKSLDQIAKAALVSSDAETRIRCILVIALMNREQRQQLLSPLANDSDAAVRQLASAVSALPDRPPATQPAAQ